RVGGRKTRISSDRVFKGSLRSIEVLGVGERLVIDVVTASEIGVISLGIDGALAAELLSQLRSQLCADLLRNRPSDVALQPKGIAQIAVVRFCPKMFVGARLNQLSCNSNSLSHSHH